MSDTFYLRAIALTVLSFAAGAVIVGLSQGFILGFAATSDSLEATKTVATLGGIAILVGSGIAIVGTGIAISHYRTGVQLQDAEVWHTTSSPAAAMARESGPPSAVANFLQKKPPAARIEDVPEKDEPGWYCETCHRFTDTPVTSHPGHRFSRERSD